MNRDLAIATNFLPVPFEKPLAMEFSGPDIKEKVAGLSRKMPFVLSLLVASGLILSACLPTPVTLRLSPKVKKAYNDCLVGLSTTSQDLLRDAILYNAREHTGDGEEIIVRDSDVIDAMRIYCEQNP